MRHEAGHTFNYAYQLYESVSGTDLLGAFQRAYRDITIVPYRSRKNLLAAWPDGTRRSIPMKTLQKRLRVGSRLDRDGDSSEGLGALAF